MSERDTTGPLPAGPIQQLRLDLAFRRAVGQVLDDLVRAAGATVALLGKNTAMRESQIRNVVDLAVATDSLLVVSNFVRYQMGRSGSKPWIDNGFGDRIVAEIEDPKRTVYKLADRVSDQVCRDIGESDKKQILGLARLRLVRLFLGYLNRWFYYASRTKEGWDDVERFVRQEAAHV
jgi:hypothetical protein